MLLGSDAAGKNTGDGGALGNPVHLGATMLVDRLVKWPNAICKQWHVSLTRDSVLPPLEEAHLSRPAPWPAGPPAAVVA